MEENCNFIIKYLLTKCGQTPLIITFEQSFLYISTLHKVPVILNKFCWAGYGSAFFKLLDPDPQKMNADPKPCYE